MDPHAIQSYSTIRRNSRRVSPKKATAWGGWPQRQPQRFHNASQPRCSLIICFNRRWDRIWVQKGVRKPIEQKSQRERPHQTYIPL